MTTFYEGMGDDPAFLRYSRITRDGTAVMVDNRNPHGKNVGLKKGDIVTNRFLEDVVSFTPITQE